MAKKSQQHKQYKHASLYKVLAYFACFALLLCMLYIPFAYSTLQNYSGLRDLENNLIDLNLIDNGAVVSDGAYNSISPRRFVELYTNKKLTEINDLISLQAVKLKSNDLLRKGFVTYYSYEYEDLASLIEIATSWFNSMESYEVPDDYAFSCDGACKFITELETILDFNTSPVPYKDLCTTHAHTAYHYLIDESVEEFELSETDWHMAYEAYILTQPQYVESITVNFCLVNSKLASSDILSNWAAYGNKFLVNVLLGKVRSKRTYTKQEDIAKLFKYIDVTSDASIVDEVIASDVPQLLYTFMYGGDYFENGDFTITNISDVEDLDSYLASIPAHKKASVFTSSQVLDVGLGALYWDITAVTHTSHPSFEELMSDEDWLRDMSYKLCEQSFWQSLYNETGD